MASVVTLLAVFAGLDAMTDNLSGYWTRVIVSVRNVSVSPLITLVIMTGLSDLVLLLIGKLYGKIQEHAPLHTIILAVITHRCFQKYEPKFPGICVPLLFVMQGRSTAEGSILQYADEGREQIPGLGTI